MKVYIAFLVDGCCEDPEVKGVYATEADAERRVKELMPEPCPVRARSAWYEEHEVL